jgi:thiosulfate/3-mercaptopyruvate sulfurtransferase
LGRTAQEENPMSTTTATIGDVSIADKGYVHPDALVGTEWLAEHLSDPGIRIVESDEDVLLYDTGHIPGAIKIDWHADLNDPLVRDYIGPRQF